MSEALKIFAEFLAADQILSAAEAKARGYGKDWTIHFEPKPSLVLLPKSYEEVQKIVRAAAKYKIPLVPSGGRTGLSGGAAAPAGEVVVSLERLNKILEVSPNERLVSCQAGVITEKLQQTLEAQGLYFPFHFSSQGSSQIGGNLATNVGGIHVIRYGCLREWVIGLKVVTADGTLLDINRALIKNQSGYDLRNLFIGSEGTLGIIVEATFRVTRAPGSLLRVLAAPKNLESVLGLLGRARAIFPTLSAFEIADRVGVEKVIKHRGLKEPFSKAYDYYLLVELEDEDAQMRSRMEDFLEQELSQEELGDAVCSSSAQQAKELLAYRDLIGETLSSHYAAHKNDLSVRVKDIPAFVESLKTVLAKEYQGIECAIFGHVGDGNLHTNILKPENLSREEFAKRCRSVDQKIYELIAQFQGSVSAEHGLGLLKKAYLSYTRSPAEINLMRAIKQLLDPNGIMNPGKVFDK